MDEMCNKNNHILVEKFHTGTVLPIVLGGWYMWESYGYIDERYNGFNNEWGLWCDSMQGVTWYM